MSAYPTKCPACGSERIRLRKQRHDWFCDDCDQRWAVDCEAVGASDSSKPLLFLSYGRRDATDLATRLKSDLEAHGYRVWMDTQEIRAGREWEHQIEDGLRSAQVIVAVLTPHAVRRSSDPSNADIIDSVCLDEISFARFARPPKSVVPVMARPCEPPFSIFRLDYVDLCAWRDSESQYQAGLERLLMAIAASLRGEVAYRAQIDHLQPWDFAAFLYEKRRNFCGREWLFNEIDVWRASCREPALLITGDPGVGKSAFVAELVHRNPGGQILAYHCCQADASATLDPARFVRSVAAMIASRLPDYAVSLDDPAVEEALEKDACAIDPFSAFQAGVLTPLQRLLAPEEGVRYLLIDGLDESLLGARPCGRGTIVDLLSRFVEQLPGWMRIVATTRREPAVLQRLAGLRARELAAQDPANIDDVENYLRQRLQSPNLSARLTQAGLSLDAAVASLSDRAAGNFLYAKELLTGVDRDLYDLADLDAFPPGLYGHYERFFERQFPNIGDFDIVRPTLEALVAADAPLSAARLTLAAGPDAERDVPRALRYLSGFVVRDETGLRLFHKSLTDWLADPARAGDPFHVDRGQGQRQLVQAILADAESGFDALSVETKAAVLRHLVSTGQWDRFDELIHDWSFHRGIGADDWAVLFAQLVQAADESQRDHLRALPLALLDVAWSRLPDYPLVVYLFQQAFAAILRSVNRDPSMAPWLAQFLTDLTNSGRDMPRFLAHRVVTNNDRARAYAGYVQEQWTQALSLLDAAGIAVSQRVREWNERIQSQDSAAPTPSVSTASQPQHFIKPTAPAADRPEISEPAPQRDKNEEQPPARRGNLRRVLSSPRSWLRSTDGTDVSVEAIARAIHRRWCDEQRRWADEQLAPSWDELDKSRKKAHREQARNIVASLGSIGCEIAPLQASDATDFTFTDEEVEKLAEARHDGWVRERIQDGRRPGPRYPEQKTSPYLDLFQNLPRDIAEFDRMFVREIPILLASAGLQVIRTG